MIGTQCFVGIDPGASGAVAWIPPAGEPHAEALVHMTDRDVLDALRWVIRMWPGARAVIEQAQGASYGALRMALVAAEIPFDLVTPQRWQGVMRCRSKRRAEELFPGLRVTRSTADALLLAEYARRTFALEPTRPLEATS